MLLLHCATDPHAIYSHYLAEILRLEGFADYAEGELAHLDTAMLAAHDLVLLPRATLTTAQVEQLTHYVHQGGKLIASLPSPNLARQFGLQALYRGIEAGYLHLNGAAAVNQG